MAGNHAPNVGASDAASIWRSKKGLIAAALLVAGVGAMVWGSLRVISSRESIDVLASPEVAAQVLQRDREELLAIPLEDFQARLQAARIEAKAMIGPTALPEEAQAAKAKLELLEAVAIERKGK